MVLQELNAARHTLLIDHQPDDALKKLMPLAAGLSALPLYYRRPLVELIALAHQQRQAYDEASEWFLRIGDLYQAGYSQLLKGQAIAANAHWEKLIPVRQNHWCITLFGLVTGSLVSLPTFLQIRNHLEADVIHLSRAGQSRMVDNMARYLDIMGEINFEAYKFFGRALLQIGDLERARQYLMHGQRILPNDPEVYYHLGQYYDLTGHRDEALLMLRQCLLISPGYMPARDLHARLQPQPSP